jgi:large subunit ribosomal protein L10
MAISKDTKSGIIAKLSDAFKEASSIVFVGFTKLTVAESSKMRKQLSQAGVRYFVAKKTLIRLVLNQQGYEGEVPELPGEIAIAWTKEPPVGDAAAADVTAPARGVYEYSKSKKLKDMLAILGGVFNGAFVDAKGMTEIAMIPPMQTLRGMFVNVINSPIQGFVMALDQISKRNN